MLLHLQQSQDEKEFKKKKKSKLKRQEKEEASLVALGGAKTVLPTHSCITTLVYAVLFICLNCFLYIIRSSFVKSPHSNGKLSMVAVKNGLKIDSFFYIG